MPILLNDSGTWRHAGVQKGLMRLWSRQPLARDPYGMGSYPIWIRGRTIWRRDGSVWTPHPGGAGADMGTPSIITQLERVGDPDGTTIRDPQTGGSSHGSVTRVTVPWGSAECIAAWVRDGTAPVGYTGWVYVGCMDNPHDGTPLKLTYGPFSTSASGWAAAVWFAFTAFPQPSGGAAFPAAQAQGFTRFAPDGIGDSDLNAYV
jgi:hypothetical protein